MEEDTEYLKLPVEDQCVHKLWKARVHGYEQAVKHFGTIEDEKSPEWNKYLGIVRKIVIDSNAVAQEKGLEAVLVFVENCGVAGKTVGEVMAGLVAKCFGAPKARTKELAMHIALMYVEIEKYEAVQEELMKGITTGKNPKVVSTCIATLTMALHEFGPKILNLKPILKHIPVILEDRDKTVREEGKKLLVELHRWIGQGLKPQLTALKPIQVSELEAEFEKLGNEKGVQTRFLRSQQDLKAKFAAKAAAGPEAEEEEEEVDAGPAVDPYDLLEPVDILSKLPKDFYDKCEAKKWQERKEAMDALEALVANPKLENGDYGDLVRALKKIITKDSNVVVVACAGKNLAGLANGLKKRFSPYAVSCISGLLEKFKEKKANVVAALRDAVDAIFPSTTLEAIQEDIVGALDNKNPAVKSETAFFLARCFSRSNATVLTKKLLKPYCAALLKTLNESDPTVRDASAEALGTALKVVGEKVLMPFLPDLEPMKLAKIKECCEKAVITGKGAPKPKAAAAPKESETVAAAAAAPVRKTSIPPKKTAAPSTTKPAAGGAKPAAKKTATKTSGPVAEEKLEREISQEEADEKSTTLLGAEAVNGLGDSNWKNRVAAMEQMLQTLRTLEKSEIPCQALMRTLCKKPGLKDTNFQVLKLKLEAVKVLAEKADFSKRSAEVCLTDIVDKLGDAKNGTGASEALTAMAETVGLDYVGQEVLALVVAHKNPKVQAEALSWMANAIKEFGLVVQPKPVLDQARKSLAATQPAVRTASIALLGTLYLFMGAPLRTLLEGEKPALLQQIDAEFEKYVGQTPPAPIRGVRPSKTGKAAAGDEEEDDEPAEPVVSVQDLIPRTDISVSITDALITELGDKNWKVRNEALQRVAAIISEAKFIKPQLGDLPSALMPRFTDSNKNLAAQAMTIGQTLATATGTPGKTHLRTMLPGVLQALSDNKAAVRSTAVSCLNTWIQEWGGIKEFFEGEIIADALKSGNPYLKADLLAWLAEQLPNAPTKGLNKEDLAACIPYLFAAIEDRSAEVRKAAQDATLSFMIHLGYETMAKGVGKLKPASKNVVQAHLDKVRPNLPAKAPPPAPAAKVVKPNTATLTRPAPSTTVSVPKEEDDSAVKPKLPKVISKSKLTGPAASRPATGRKKDDDTDTSPWLQVNNLKNQRINDELKLKTLKWNFATPRDEFIEQLKEQMTTANFNKTLMANMFHADFKFHLKALEVLSEDVNSNLEAHKANLDLVLKWLTLRFFDTNPSVLLKGLEYLNSVFNLLSSQGYSLVDAEASSFLPYLLLKVGDPKDAVRNSVHAILKLICLVYPAGKLFNYVMDGIKSKNARQRTECLEELGSLIESHGILVCQPSPAVALKEIAKQIADRDNSVRNAALNCLVQAYFQEDAKIYKMIGNLSDKDMSLLEERIRRSAKNRPPPSAVPKQASPEVKPTVARTANVRAAAEAAPKSDSETSPAKNVRPISGIFALELEQAVQNTWQQDKCSDIKVDLVQVDLDDILQPVSIPRLNPANPPWQTLQTTTNSNFTSLTRNFDATNIDLWISQVANPDATVSLSALTHLEGALSQDNSGSLGSRMDQLLTATTIKLKLLYAMQEENWTESFRLFKAVLKMLIAIYKQPKLAQRPSRDVLRNLLHVCLQIMSDPRMDSSEEGNSVTKTLNYLVVKIVDHSDHTAVIGALMRLLHEAVGNENANSKFVELIMKCLWKATRSLPEWAPTLNLSSVLLELHLFLKSYPSSMWKKRSSDTPMRTVKTFVHTLAKIEGNRLLSHLQGIPDISESELEPYLQKAIKGGSGKEGTTEPQPGLDDTPTKGGRRLPKASHDALSTIFKKIGTKEQSREGLAELYDFKLQHPDADIEPFLKKSSEFFRNYIDRGLKVIEQERLRCLTKPSGIPTATNGSSTGDVGKPLEQEGLNAMTALERLKKLRTLAGLDNQSSQVQVSSITQVTTSTSVSSVSAVPKFGFVRPVTVGAEMKPLGTENTNNANSQPESRSGSSSEVEDLRRRLQMVKNASLK